jgi:hypothetical protein
MLKRILISVLIICFFSGLMFSEKMGDIDDIFKPFIMRVDSNTLYISDQYFVYFFSTNDLKLINKIGGKGEGPGFFRTEPRLKILKNKILAYDIIQFYFLSKSGKQINGNRFPNIFFSLDYVEGNFVMAVSNLSSDVKNFYVTDFVVLDHLFKKIKVIHTIKRPIYNSPGKRKKYLVEPLTKFQCYNDKTYLVDGQLEFHIKVFDAKGKPVKEIQKKLERRKVTESFKKRKYDEFVNNPVIKKRWHIFEKMYECVFPEYFPDIQDFRIADGKIYIKTYKYLENRVEFIILDLDGKLLGKVYLPDVKNTLFDINNNWFYYLKEDETAEVWELFKTRILSDKKKDHE